MKKRKGGKIGKTTKLTKRGREGGREKEKRKIRG